MPTNPKPKRFIDAQENLVGPLDNNLNGSSDTDGDIVDADETELLEVEEIVEVEVEPTSDVVNAWIDNTNNTNAINNVKRTANANNDATNTTKNATKPSFPDPADCDFTKATFDNMILDADRQPIGVFGILHENFHAKKHLRCVACAFDVWHSA